jgi:hypothetical protein
MVFCCDKPPGEPVGTQLLGQGRKGGIETFVTVKQIGPEHAHGQNRQGAYPENASQDHQAPATQIVDPGAKSKQEISRHRKKEWLHPARLETGYLENKYGGEQ